MNNKINMYIFLTLSIDKFETIDDIKKSFDVPPRTNKNFKD